MTVPFATPDLETMERIDIAPAAVIAALTGGFRADATVPARAVLRCEGVDVALIARHGTGDGVDVLAVACTHPCHGVHPRFAEAAARLRAILGEKFGAPRDRVCGVCGGAAWIGLPSVDANYQIMLAQCLRVWRGVTLPPTAGAEGQTGQP